MYDSLDEANEAEVTFEQARREVMKHRASVVEFLDEVGSKATYEGREVLSWLGY